MLERLHSYAIIINIVDFVGSTPTPFMVMPVKCYNENKDLIIQINNSLFMIINI